MADAEKQTQIEKLERRLRKTTPGTTESKEIQTQIQKLKTQQAHAVKTPLEVFRQDYAARTPEGPEPAALCESYLNWLRCETGEISLTGIDMRSATEGECQDLDDIYTALLTVGAEEMEKGEREIDPNQFMERRAKPLSALARLDRHRHLVLLGGPGSGKSTFVNFVAMCLAGASAGNPDRYLGLLTEPLPDQNGDPQEERQPWQHGALLPLRIILRDFAARGLPPKDEELTDEHLWKFLGKELPSHLKNFSPFLQRYFLEQGGILLLDGLDEVPDADRYRLPIKTLVESLARLYPHCRIVVTSRTYAYQKQGWRLGGFDETVLAPFSKGQICRFVDRWYPNAADAYDLSPEQAAQRAAQLKAQILEREALYTLAERPLLLTLMASLHAWRLRDLPKKRVELYKETVELLLDRWERRKFPGQDEAQQPKSLLEWLKADKEAVLTLLSELAFQAHQQQLDAAGLTADIPEKALTQGLLDISGEEVRPKLLVGYLRDRTGLLIPHGVEVYTFPHRTFQEYLAACHLTEQDDYPENIVDLARQDPNRWREVVLLAAARFAEAPLMLWGLAEALCYQEFNEGDTTTQDAWGALLAGQALVESAKLGKISPRNRPKVERIQKWLVAILTKQQPKGKAFPVVERALAGNLLAVLGDPRSGVGLREDGLPDIEWCEVPAGEFLMGDTAFSNAPPHRVTVSGFHISRYSI
ncbi:MAG: NACHT domain-containing protein, partial [bacterium]|nr:NACHT domain-containing protein [bacterium]